MRQPCHCLPLRVAVANLPPLEGTQVHTGLPGQAPACVNPAASPPHCFSLAPNCIGGSLLGTFCRSDTARLDFVLHRDVLYCCLKIPGSKLNEPHSHGETDWRGAGRGGAGSNWQALQGFRSVLGGA